MGRIDHSLNLNQDPYSTLKYQHLFYFFLFHSYRPAGKVSFFNVWTWNPSQKKIKNLVYKFPFYSKLLNNPSCFSPFRSFYPFIIVHTCSPTPTMTNVKPQSECAEQADRWQVLENKKNQEEEKKKKSLGFMMKYGWQTWNKSPNQQISPTVWMKGGEERAGQIEWNINHWSPALKLNRQS